MDSLGRHLCCFLVAFFFVASTSVYALAPPVTPVGLRNLVESGGSVSGRLTYQIGKGSAASYIERGILFSGTTLGRLGTGALRLGGGPAYLAMLAIVQGAGYLWDSSSEKVMTPDSPGGQPCSPYYHDGFLGVDGCSYSDWRSLFRPALVSWVAGLNGSPAAENILFQNENIDPGGTSTVTVTWDQVYSPSNTSHKSQAVNVFRKSGTATPPSVPGDEVSDQTVGDLVVSNGDPQLWQQLLVDPVTGQPITTPEVEQAIWDLQKEKVEEDGGDPQTVPAPTVTGGVDPAASEPVPESEIPGFCVWASAACDFYDWAMGDFDEPESVPLPTTDIPLPSSWDSGLGTSACPADTVIPLWDGASVSIPWSTACSAVDLFRPFLLIVASIIAAGILIGRKN